MNLSLDDNYEESLRIDKDEYIKSLEISIQLLQREIESLRKKNIQNSSESISDTSDNIIFKNIESLINGANSKSELINILGNILNQNKLVLEWQLFNFIENKDLTPFDSNQTNDKIQNEIIQLEEEGVIDWVLSNLDVKIVPSLYDSTDGRTIYNIFIPMNIGTQYILFLGKTIHSIDELSDDIKLSFKQLIQAFTLKLDNIISLEHINEISKQLENQKNRKKDNFSELIKIAFSEFDQPIELIESNLDLIDRGIGDTKRRNEIIKENIIYLKNLKSKLRNLLFEKSSSTEFDFKDLLNEISFLTKNQLQRDGINLTISITKNYSYTGDKKILESLFTYLILFSSDLMPDSGNLVVSLQKKKEKFIFKFYYDNALLTNSEFEKINEGVQPENISNSIFNMLKKIISISKENKFNLELINDKKIGSTISVIIT